MTRADELTDRLIDGPLTAAEAAELEALLAADPAGRARYLGLLDLEASLRGLRTDLDLGPATVARIEADRADRAAAAVLTGIADRPAPGWAHRRPRRRLVVGAALTALAAAALAAVWLSRPLDPAPEQPQPSRPTDGLAHLVVLAGTVEVSAGGGPVAADLGQALNPGQTVRTVGEDSSAVLEFADHTRIELHPESAVRLAAGGDGLASPRRLVLEEGQVTAVVTGGPMVVGAGATDVVARHGRFALWSSGPGSARVELQEGDVQVVRGDAPVALSPGRAAFVLDGAGAVSMDPAYRVDSAPRDRLDFRGALDLAFSTDGSEVWAASGKQFVRWRGGAAVTRTPISPAVFNDGPVAVLTGDRRSLVACRVDDKEDRVLVLDLPAGTVRHTLPVRATEPRFLCAAPDAGWVATNGPKPNNRVRVWDTATGRERFAREFEGGVFCMAASPDGRLLAVEQSDLRRETGNRVVFLDAATGEPAFSLPTRRRQVTALAFTADGRHMAAGFNGAVQVWDVPGRRLVRTLAGFERVVTRLAFGGPDGALLAAGTQDGQVWVWEAGTGRRVQVIDTGTRGVRAVAFSPDGRRIVTATNKSPVALWDVPPVPAGGHEPDA